MDGVLQKKELANRTLKTVDNNVAADSVGVWRETIS